MRPIVLVSMAAAAGLALAFGGAARSAEPQQSMRLLADGALHMEGRKLRCADADLRLDRSLPNLGAAAPGEGTLWINPRLLARETAAVRLFVFHHECGHLHVGASELESDCWAVDRGVETGWLDRDGLKEVCDSFDDAPESSTHPSGRRRCANLDRCFAAATAKKRPRPPVEVASARGGAPQSLDNAGGGVPSAAATPSAPAVAATNVATVSPRLVGAPRLLWTGETDDER